MPRCPKLLALAAATLCGLGLLLPVRPAATAPGAAVRVVDLATPEAIDTLILGAAEKDQLGNDLGAGDVNDDGLLDLVAGANWGSGTGRNIVGRSYAIFGRLLWPAQLDLNQSGQLDWSFMGEGRESRLGSAVASGDLNGDGIDDLALGSLLADPGDRTNAGAVYIMLGGKDVKGRVDFLTDEADASIIGASTRVDSDQLGTDLAIGDFNGDGKKDIAVASVFRADRAGAVFVWWGPFPRGRRLNRANQPANWTITGPAQNALFGATIEAGDVTGDGIDDLLASAFNLRDGPAGSGVVHIFPGSRTAGGTVDLAEAVSPIEVVGRENMYLGGAISPGSCSCRGLALVVSDITGDDKPDLIAGAPLSGGRLGGIRLGEVVVLAGPLALGRHDLATRPHLSLGGVLPDARLGWSLATGHLDDDGQLDLVLAAPWADPKEREDAGVVYGLRGPLPAVGEIAMDSAPLVIYGAEAGGGNASVTALLADTDGDEHDDLHLGFPDTDPFRRQSVGIISVLRGPLLETLVTATPTATNTATATDTPTPTATFTASPTATETAVPPTATATTPVTPTSTATRGTPRTPTATRRPATATRDATMKIIPRAYLPRVVRARPVTRPSAGVNWRK
jgi:hypothetical protein